MNSIYRPDLWVVVELKYNDREEISRKVLASWYGGYLGGDRWKLSSGITETIEHENHYEFINHSGSIYECGKHMVGMSGYTSSVFESFKKDLEGTGSIEVIDIRSE
jgi:sulfatase maturation enzyme AslB (radical SAM superfamily)